MKSFNHLLALLSWLLPFALGTGGCSRDGSTVVEVSRNIVFLKYLPSTGTTFRRSKTVEGYAVTVIPQQKPETFYSSYVGALFRAPGNLCSIQFKALNYPWKMFLIEANGREIWGAASAYKTGPYSDFITLSTGALYRLVFAHPGPTTDPVGYTGVELHCESGDSAARTPSYSERVQNEIITPAVARQDENRIPRQDELVSSFETLAAELREMIRLQADDAAVQDFLLRGYENSRELLLSAHGDKLANKDVRLVFATYLAHFSVHLSFAADLEPRAIILAGNGTCWQQAQVAEFIHRLMTLNEAHLSSLDWLVVGHTVVASETFLLDATHNLVIFIGPAAWSRMSPAQRILALQHEAVFGYSRDLNPAKPSPFAKPLGGPKVLRSNWRDLVSRYPFTTVCCSIIDAAAIPN